MNDRMRFKTYLHIILFTIIITATNSSVFPMSLWGNFHKNSNQIHLSHTSNSLHISFLERLTSQWSCDQIYSGRNINILSYKNNDLNMTVYTDSQSIAIEGKIVDQIINISPKLWKSLNQKLTFYLDSTIVNSSSIQLINQNATNVQIRLSFDRLLYGNDTFGDDLQKSISFSKIFSQLSVKTFMASYKIQPDYYSFTNKMIQQTFFQICIQEHEFSNYFGLCYNEEDDKSKQPHFVIDISYSFLIIELLFEQYNKLAFWLFENMIDLLEDRLFYQECDFVKIPEHIQIISLYVQRLELHQPSVNLDELNNFHVRIKAVLNGLINQMLLADVNNLEQEINYRQNKKLHPTLARMLALKWKSYTLKNALSSIYEESFLHDYYYNSAKESLDTCVSKTAWLTAATLQYAKFIKNFGNQDDNGAIEQPISLYKILNHVASSDNHAKQGRYYSINLAEGIRVYVDQVGYESFLPYIYQLTTLFPNQLISNITTQYGLASINLNHRKFSSNHHFRGNINLYFNYKILTKTKNLTKNPQLKNKITILLNRVKSKIIEFSKNQLQSWTSWDIQGKGYYNQKSLSILNAVMLSETFNQGSI